MCLNWILRAFSFPCPCRIPAKGDQHFEKLQTLKFVGLGSYGLPMCFHGKVKSASKLKGKM